MRFALPRNYGCRLWDQHTYKGMQVVVLENDLLRISVLADKGTDIFEFLYKSLDLDYMLMTPQGIRTPQEVGSVAQPDGPSFGSEAVAGGAGRQAQAGAGFRDRAPDG